MRAKKRLNTRRTIFASNAGSRWRKTQRQRAKKERARNGVLTAPAEGTGTAKAETARRTAEGLRVRPFQRMDLNNRLPGHKNQRFIGLNWLPLAFEALAPGIYSSSVGGTPLVRV